MPEDKTLENNEVLEKLEDINKELIEMNKSQATVSSMMKREETKKLKEETTSEKKEVTVVVGDEGEEKTSRQMEALRKIFSDTFSGIKDVLSPGGLLKSFGLFSGSPIFMLLGDKLDNIIQSYKDHSAESNKDRDKLIKIQTDEQKDRFLDEQRRSEELAVSERTNELLEEINDKEFAGDVDKKGILDFIKAPLSLIASLLPISLTKAFTSSGFLKTFGKVFGKIGLTGTIGGLGKILKGGTKLLGKLALPLAVLVGGIDFIKGFKNAFEITGREGFVAKIQGGISEAISGFTFGLVDAKTISKGIDFLVEKLKAIYTAPLNLIMDLWEGDKPFLESMSKFYSAFTFGLLKPETIEKGYRFVIDKFMSILTEPLEMIKKLWDGEATILDNVSNLASTFTFGLLKPETIQSAFDFFINTIKSIFINPFMALKEYITSLDILGNIKELLSGISFDLLSRETIEGGVALLTEKILNIFSKPLDMLKELKENLTNITLNAFDMVKNTLAESAAGELIAKTTDAVGDISIDEIKNQVTELNDKIKNKLGFLTDIIKSPFEAIKTKLFGEDEEATKNITVHKIDDTRRDDIVAITQPGALETEKISAVQTENIVLKKIQEENMARQRRELEQKTSIEKEGQQNNIMNNNVNNNIIPQEDMSTKTDDINWNAMSLTF